MTSGILRLLLASEGEYDVAHRLLESMPDFSVVGRTRLGDETVALARAARPHAVIVHLAAAEPAAFESMRRLTHHVRESRLLVLADRPTDGTVHEALRAGANAFLSGAITSAELHAAVHAAMHGGIYLDAATGRAFVGSCLQRGNRSTGPTPLTARQHEVLMFIAEGRSTKQIAARLRISIKTVETHRAHIMRRLDIYDVASLVRYAIRQGLVQPDA